MKTAATLFTAAKKGRELPARDQLRIAQRAAALIRCLRGNAQRFAVGQARRNHTLVTVRGLVHPVFRLA